MRIGQPPAGARADKAAAFRQTMAGGDQSNADYRKDVVVGIGKTLIAVLLSLAAAYGQQPSPGSGLSLAGEWKLKPAQVTLSDLYSPAIDDTSWEKVVLPANWHLLGEDLDGAVWFRRHFRFPARDSGEEIELVFEGVDYSADVWLNGTHLGSHEGYFEPFRFHVSGHLRYGGDNVLAVLVNSPKEEVGKVWSLRKRLIKGVLNHHDTRPGGAWSVRGQEQNTGGIWGPVYLRMSKQVAIETVRAVPEPSSAASELSDGQVWNLPVRMTVDNPGRAPRSVQIRVAVEPENFVAAEQSGGTAALAAKLEPGESQIELKVISSNTRLWSSWDRGQPNLYRLRVQILDPEGLLDESELVVGFRTITVDADKQWILNGKRIFLRGTNYISTQWLSEMTREKYNFDIALMKRAFINAVRVHAHVEASDFYRSCDEAGILVSQDFPLQWGYSEDSEFTKEAVRQGLAMVSVLGNHPSIISWTMQNEPPFDAFWMVNNYKDYNPQQNKQLNDALYRAVSAADPSRYTGAYSSTAEHPWLGWYSGSWLDYGKPTRQAFITEFGAQALPGLASLVKIVGPENLWPDTPEKWEVWSYHNFQKREMFEMAHVAQGSTIEEFIRNTQNYQAKVTQFAAESYRRQKFQPVTAIFQFMFAEEWPSMNWGMLDHWRNPKLAYDALATAYQPILPSIAYSKDVWKQTEKVSFDLWIVNDTLEAYPASRLKLTLRSPDGSSDEQEIVVDIEPDSSRQVMTFDRSRLAAGTYLLCVQVANAGLEVLGRNLYSFQVVE